MSQQLKLDAPLAQIVPEPPLPDRNTRCFSKSKPFGLKMFMQGRSTVVSGETAIIAELKVSAEDLGKRRFPCDAEPVGVCTAKIKRWPTVHGDSFETSIDEIGGITNDRLLNQQVLIALVRVLWNTGPLGIGCTNHLVINQKLHIPREVWALLECMGFHVCKCHGSTLILAKDVKWCLGERLGTEDTATTEEDDEVEEGDDEEDDEVEEGDDEEDDEVEEGDEEEHDEVEEGDEEDRDLEEGGIPS